MTARTATTDHAVHSLIAARWSPYAFGPKSVADEDLRSLFEAARWAASSYNEQPWHYIVARRDDTEAFEKLLSALVTPNQAWAKAAAVLAIGVVALRDDVVPGLLVVGGCGPAGSFEEREEVFVCDGSGAERVRAPALCDQCVDGMVGHGGSRCHRSGSPFGVSYHACAR